MATPRLRRTRHIETVAAPPRRVYDLIADVTRWPQIFGPTVSVQRLDPPGAGGAAAERLRIWALANGEVRDWTSRRELDPAGMRIRFRQEVAAHPVAAMGGHWQVVPRPHGGALVVLDHDYRAVDDDEAAARWIEQAIDRNSESELAALRDTAEMDGGRDEIWLSFADTVGVDGAAEDVYELLARAERWPRRLPHVARLNLREDVPGIQHLEMDTRAPDGTVHTTSSVRVCVPHSHIAYKQLVMPAVLRAHTGRWTIAVSGDGVLATSEHTVVLRPETIAERLGPGVSLAEARTRVRHALGTNSRATLGRAKAFAEARRLRRAA
ncbi:MAG TPA: aromatase/cyclase [Mycobacteriales bacterium]|nr:aromatase/cyclase [Mycobacteriales bacterium]